MTKFWWLLPEGMLAADNAISYAYSHRLHPLSEASVGYLWNIPDTLRSNNYIYTFLSHLLIMF